MQASSIALSVAMAIVAAACTSCFPPALMHAVTRNPDVLAEKRKAKNTVLEPMLVQNSFTPYAGASGDSALAVEIGCVQCLKP